MPSGNVRRLPRRSSRVTVPQVALDGDDLAAPVGGDLLDDQALVGRDLDGAAAPRRAPVGVQDVGAVAVVGRHPPTLVRRPDRVAADAPDDEKALAPTARDISSTYREQS